MDRKIIHEMVEMRMEGASWAEIGASFGMSKQGAQQLVHDAIGSRGSRTIAAIRYPGIAAIMKKRRMSVTELSDETNISYASLLLKLKGQRPFKKEEIDRLIQATGASYDTLFGGTTC